MSNTEIKKLMLSIPGRLSKESLAGINGTIQFDLDSESSETWLLSIQEGKGEIKRGKATKPDATFIAGSQDFFALLSGNIEEIGWSFMQGKIVFEGDISIVWRVLSQLRSD
jgi:putative sterol carrier protein